MSLAIIYKIQRATPTSPLIMESFKQVQNVTLISQAFTQP